MRHPLKALEKARERLYKLQSQCALAQFRADVLQRKCEEAADQTRKGGKRKMPKIPRPSQVLEQKRQEVAVAVANAAALAVIPPIVSESKKCCVICQFEIAGTERCHALQCGDAFHMDCLKSLISSGFERCPHCAYAIAPEWISDIQAA
jgi:hypothetical protein